MKKYNKYISNERIENIYKVFEILDIPFNNNDYMNPMKWTKRFKRLQHPSYKESYHTFASDHTFNKEEMKQAEIELKQGITLQRLKYYS